jgi:hypothetical protein
LFGAVKNIYARWVLRSFRHERSPQPDDWNSVSRLAIILSDRSDVNKSGIDRFVEETGKYVEVFYVETGARKPSYADWNCLTRKHSTAMDTPRREVLAGMKGKRFDVVINAATDRFSAVLSGSINAALRCACTPKYREADLVITNTNGLGDYLSQVLRYLRMIRPRRR